MKAKTNGVQALVLLLMSAGIPFSYAVSTATYACMDGVDNDSDGHADFPGDLGCAAPTDPNEEVLGPYEFCPHTSPHSHSYGTGGGVGLRSDSVTGGQEMGFANVNVYETNLDDCNGDGIPWDYDGDWDAGTGGGFMGYGAWADEALCSFGLRAHAGTVVADDVVFGRDIWFTIGADDTSGPDLTQDPNTGQYACTTDGSITPGDPSVDPTADEDDCLTEPLHGSGTTCGAGGDGGYWVFLNGLLVSETEGNPGVSTSPTSGTITA